jgi:hypothetical protein
MPKNANGTERGSWNTYGATDLLGGSSNGETVTKNEVDGVTFDFAGKTDVRHDCDKSKRLEYRTDDDENYRPLRKSCNDAVRGILTV